TRPAPDTAWYVLATSRRNPAATWRGFSTGIAAIVVQFGLATFPFGTRSSACGLTSATTSGTSGSMRQAEELSTTIAPSETTFGASRFEVAAPAENSTTSRPEKSAV